MCPTPPPRIARHRDSKPRSQSRVAAPSAFLGPCKPSPVPELTIEIITTATMAAVERYLASIDIHPRSTAALQRDEVGITRSDPCTIVAPQHDDVDIVWTDPQPTTTPQYDAVDLARSGSAPLPTSLIPTSAPATFTPPYC